MTGIPISLARNLKDAGLNWQPALHDEFAIPDRGLNDRTFVISDMLSTIQSIRGTPVVSFHGSLEWALDSLVTSEVVWMPTETQLRELVIESLGAATGQVDANGRDPKDPMILRRTGQGYVCEIYYAGEMRTFRGNTAHEAYGLALLELIAKSE